MAYNYNPNGANDELNDDDLEFAIGGVPYNVGVEYAREHGLNVGDNQRSNDELTEEELEHYLGGVPTGRGRR